MHLWSQQRVCSFAAVALYTMSRSTSQPYLLSHTTKNQPHAPSVHGQHPPPNVHGQQGVTCIGYTDLPSRMAKQASTLYSNNISKFLLSMGPFTGNKGHFYIDDKDDAVRGALVLQDGTLRWPAPPLQVGSTTQRGLRSSSNSSANCTRCSNAHGGIS